MVKIYEEEVEDTAPLKSTRKVVKTNIYLTPEGLKNTQEELKFLKDTKLKEVAQRISQAREFDGDEENTEFDAAVQEHDLVEMKIATLEQVLKNAKLIKREQRSVVSLGSTVALMMDGKREEYTIVGKMEANPIKRKVSNESPIGAALLGASIGQEVEVKTPVSNYLCKVLEIQ